MDMYWNRYDVPVMNEHSTPLETPGVRMGLEALFASVASTAAVRLAGFWKSCSLDRTNDVEKNCPIILPFSRCC